MMKQNKSVIISFITRIFRDSDFMHLVLFTLLVPLLSLALLLFASWLTLEPYLTSPVDLKPKD